MNECYECARAGPMSLVGLGSPRMRQYITASSVSLTPILYMESQVIAANQD